jgi:hypothetical protein
METVGDSEKDRWILFAQYHKRNVSKVSKPLTALRIRR